jgi:S-adenosylmethionine:tRNA ribosyltransferase-isomerase
MKLSQYKYHLPRELIADFPAKNRDEARLMVIDRKTETIEHKLFKDIIDYFEEDDVIVRNDTQVFPALLWGRKEKTASDIQIFLLRELEQESHLWDVLVEPARKIRIGNKVYFGEDDELVAEVIDNTTPRGRTLRFLFDGTHEECRKKLYDLGQMPLPECVQALRSVTPEDREHYQTIYAKNEGAVVAPAAGLHFSKLLIKRLELKGIHFADVTLHAGVGNFKTIDVEDLGKHKVDSEEMMITEEAAQIINRAKQKKKQICVVGTTTMKALESSVYDSGLIKPHEGWTNKFVFPPHNFKSATAFVTNFHPSQSSMFMMACAFAGDDLIMKAYKIAVEEKYRFLTYGDAMLLL